MLKTISAALVAASLMFAPGLAPTADAAQGATKPVATRTVKTVKVAKTGKRRYVLKHHRRHTDVKSVRPVKKHAIKRDAKITRHGKIVKAHRHSHVVTVKPRVN